MEYFTTLPFGGAGGVLGYCPIVIPPRQFTPVNGQPVRWIRPPPGWIKINTDGAVRSRTSGASSCGGVYRDFRGFIVGAFSSFLGYNMSALEAEMSGVMMAINGAFFMLRLRKVWLECDSLQTVLLIKNLVTDERIPESIRDKWRSRIELMQHMEIRVSHIYREGNTVADKLAEYAIQTKELCTTWAMAPDFVVEEANLDAMGHTYVRVKRAS